MLKLYEVYESGEFKTSYHIQLEIIETFVKQDSGTILYTGIIRSVHHDQKFVIRGYQGLTPLSFVELLNIFDKHVWL